MSCFTASFCLHSKQQLAVYRAVYSNAIDSPVHEQFKTDSLGSQHAVTQILCYNLLSSWEQPEKIFDISSFDSIAFEKFQGCIHHI